MRPKGRDENSVQSPNDPDILFEKMHGLPGRIAGDAQGFQTILTGQAEKSIQGIALGSDVLPSKWGPALPPA